ncbi:hypothetical protein FRC12_020987 [Ceratobasidium sp. 428]|nr:hypothetical protein FRC12_020987 [Ceratobasidium sp. 428]
MMATPIAQVFIGNVVNTPTLGQLDILEEHVILVDVNGFITDVCPLSAPSPAALHYLHNMPQNSITRLPPTSFFAPTFVDLHLHAPQFMYLGTGLHLPLLIWLDEYAYKAEERLDSDPELAKKACSGVSAVGATVGRERDWRSARVWNYQGGYEHDFGGGVHYSRHSHLRRET